MKRFLATMVLGLLVAAPPVNACMLSGMWSSSVCGSSIRDVRKAGVTKASLVSSWGSTYSAGPKPRKWCGWWMRTQFGGGPEYNRAWAWRKRGVAAHPHVGAVVVWRHHVGYIVGVNAKGQWLVKSGNDGNAVRVRARSLKGAVIRGMV